MSTNLTILLLLLVVLIVCIDGNGVYAFGAGNIPSFAYMEGRAFRHGDIEDVLADLVRKGAGGGFALGSLIGKGGSKFSGLDIKRVYFGNWLRDYSQAVDIAGLKKLQLQTIINLCMALGFLAHGYATNEFEVTIERLGVYLPTEHIDNPKGYGDGEDARKYHPQLRGPVDPRELEVDHQTGMKNYIANEYGGWDTSKALVRRTLEKCIHLGRQHRAQNRKEDLYEAYRLLGQALHTLEDFSAHSNFCELALASMGHHDVFLHVGDQVRIQAPNGKWVAPIVTGTFGSDDFIHSLLGEAGDHLSQASVSDLNKQLDSARSKSQSTRSGPGRDDSTALRQLFSTLPAGAGGEMASEMDDIERIRAGTDPATGGKKPEEMSPQELHAVLWRVLKFRDSVMKKIEKTIEKIPGLGALLEKLIESISVFVFTTLEPFLKPVLQSATSGLQSASGEVIDSHDQYEVFNDPRASDPTHSFLSKDHFNLILNEPAGHIAKVVVVHTVTQVIKAWDDNSMNVHAVTEDITSCLFHPDFHNHNSTVQRQMLQAMHDWVKGLGGKQHETLRRLVKNAVRNHENIRLAGDGGKPSTEGSYAHQQGVQMQSNIQGYLHQIPGVSQASSLLNAAGGGQGSKREGPSDNSGYPGASHGHGHGLAPAPSGGQASSYYNAGSASDSYSGGGGGGGSSYAPPPPSGPPASSYGGAPSNSYGSAPSSNYGSAPSSNYGSAPSSNYGGAPSSNYGGVPSFPGGGSNYTPPSAQAQGHAGYTPSYASPPPSFPGSAPSFPGSGGGPSFPGADYNYNSGGGGYGSSPPPAFPGAGGGAGPGGFGMPDPAGGFQPSYPGQGAPQFPGGPSYPQHNQYGPY